jgi:hypothetical protein
VLLLEDRRHYVYAHARSDTGEIFYVGKGSGRRAFAFTGRSAWHSRVVSKCGADVHILARGLTKTEAYRYEKQLIAESSELCIRLVNLSAGGEGNDGHVHSPSVRAAISKGNTGKLVSGATKEKLRACFLGRAIPVEQRTKIRAALAGRKAPAVAEANKLRRGVSRMPDVQMRMTAALRAKCATPEHREKMRLMALTREANKRAKLIPL